MYAVPVNDQEWALSKIGASGLPTGLSEELDRVGGTATFTAWTVGESVEFTKKCRLSPRAHMITSIDSLNELQVLLRRCRLGVTRRPSRGAGEPKPNDPRVGSEPLPLSPQGRAGLSHQYEGRVVSQGHCDGDVYGAVDQQARDCDRSGTGGERGRERPCAARGHRDGDRVGRRHARQVARAHEGRGHVADAPELDAQDGRRGGQKRNTRARRP